MLLEGPGAMRDVSIRRRPCEADGGDALWPAAVRSPTPPELPQAQSAPMRWRGRPGGAQRSAVQRLLHGTTHLAQFGTAARGSASVRRGYGGYPSASAAPSPRVDVKWRGVATNAFMESRQAHCVAPVWQHRFRPRVTAAAAHCLGWSAHQFSPSILASSSSVKHRAAAAGRREALRVRRRSVEGRRRPRRWAWAHLVELGQYRSGRRPSSISATSSRQGATARSRSIGRAPDSSTARARRGPCCRRAQAAGRGRRAQRTSRGRATAARLRRC